MCCAGASNIAVWQVGYTQFYWYCGDSMLNTPSPSRLIPGRGRRTGPTPSTVEREQAMRDYKLSIEYKHLKQHCPGGVYLVPSYDDLRLFHGVIFVRRGAFTNG